jgi:hypothetical protein
VTRHLSRAKRRAEVIHPVEQSCKQASRVYGGTACVAYVHRAINEVGADEDTAREFSLEVVSNAIEELPHMLDSKDGILTIAQTMNLSRYIERR